MTEKEIVQALRCCSDQNCGNCLPCEYHGYGDCLERLTATAADTIERLMAEDTYKALRIISDSAAALERLAEENVALLEKVPKWSRVEDRLPMPGTRVIVTNGRFTGEAYRGERGEWRRYDTCQYVFDVTGHEVTHWMPFPEAPEEGDKHGTTD